MLDSVTDLRIFAQVARLGGFSAAGRALDLTPGFISKRVARLEERAGVRLLHRTTRQISLTDEGRDLLHRCEQILAEVDEAEAALGQGHAEPRGTLRVTAPASIGRVTLARAVADYLGRYPQARVFLHVSDAVVDLVEEGFDVAVRVGELRESSLIARRLAALERVVVAAPAYLEAHGTPATPADLAQHECLTMQGQDRWEFEGPHGQETVKVSGRFVSTNGDAMRDAAVAGLGLAEKSTWNVRAELERGALVPVLPEYRLRSRAAIHALYPSRRQLSAKVRAFVDVLAEHFGRRNRHGTRAV